MILYDYPLRDITLIEKSDCMFHVNSLRLMVMLFFKN